MTALHDPVILRLREASRAAEPSPSALSRTRPSRVVRSSGKTRTKRQSGLSLTKEELQLIRQLRKQKAEQKRKRAFRAEQRRESRFTGNPIPEDLWEFVPSFSSSSASCAQHDILSAQTAALTSTVSSRRKTPPLATASTMVSPISLPRLDLVTKGEEIWQC